MTFPSAIRRQPLGRTGLQVPRLIFGTSCLGNLYQAIPWETKRAIVSEAVAHVPAPLAFDSAGKYGAGLALECLGRALRELDVGADGVLVSNKLGWARTPLRGPEPTFEPGVWAGLQHDAAQRIDYEGIRACFEQGAQLLGEPYRPQLASVHDPDEYLAAAADPADRQRRWHNVQEAYRALHDLKRAGRVRAVGVGAKDWRVIRALADAVELDWVMLACSFTVHRHPPELLAFIDHLHRRGTGLINSAVFNAGFLIGGRYYDYRVPDPAAPADQPLFAWRERFLAACARHGVAPAAACVQFGLSAPGIAAVALNTGKPDHVKQNVAMVQAELPSAFWADLKRAGLIDRNYLYLG